jgi:pantothenate kinase type III
MYERFTDRARKVMVLANEQAHRFTHEYVGTEHILLGLIKEGSGVGARVLKDLGIDLRRIRLEVEKLVQSGPDLVTPNKLQQTPRAKKVIEYAMEESRTLKHEYVGSEHLLLGLIREEEGVAAQVLLILGLDSGTIRSCTLRLLGPSFARRQSSSSEISDARADGPGYVRQLFESPLGPAADEAPKIPRDSQRAATVVAVDVGNSQIKLGQFANRGDDDNSLPEPLATLELTLSNVDALFDVIALSKWCTQHLSPETVWLIGSVNRRAGELLSVTVSDWARQLELAWPVKLLTYRDLPIEVRVDEPARVGIDRLLAAVAANRLRSEDRAAIVVDLGTAITVDLVETDGAFAGGAILPGIGTAGRALADQTDALPHVALDPAKDPPAALGKSTTAAIQSGLYWGTVGAVSEIATRLATGLPTQPDYFITGGAASTVVGSIATSWRVQHVPHLVLSGIALLARTHDESAG